MLWGSARYRPRMIDAIHYVNRRCRPAQSLRFRSIFASLACVALVSAVSWTSVAAGSLSSAGPGGIVRYLGDPIVGSGATSVAQAGVSPFGLGLLIADRGNGRLLIVNQAKKILWRFPTRGSLPAGQRFAADDAFLAPDGKTIVANDEAHHVIDRIDIVTRKVVWQYGHYGHPGSARGYLHTPDDAYPLGNGDVTVADINNCRVIEISPAKKIVHQWGRTGVCTHHPPRSYASPNGGTPLPDGGILITEIHGSHVVRLSATGKVLFDLHVPVAYPSDAQLDAQGNVLVADYSNPGAVLRITPKGRVLWRYASTTYAGRLNHPSLAIFLPNGLIAVNDDLRARVVVIDPRTKKIVWQYGHTGVGGSAAGYLFEPDGVDIIPLGTRL